MSHRKARELRRRSPGESPDDTRGRRRRSAVIVAIAAASVVALVAAGVFVARDTGPAQAVSSTSGSSVSFSGADPITGKNVSLTDYAGKPVVINVWGSWCEGCVAEAVDLRTFVERHPEIQMIGVDLQDTKAAARAFYARWGWRHPGVFDPRGEISVSLGLQGTPTTFFLDREHRIVTRIVGATDLAGFERGLQEALSPS